VIVLQWSRELLLRAIADSNHGLASDDLCDTLLRSSMDVAVSKVSNVLSRRHSTSLLDCAVLSLEIQWWQRDFLCLMSSSQAVLDSSETNFMSHRLNRLW